MSEVNKKLGALLKKERERQSIKIEDLAEKLKISLPYLQAIENGTTEGLPSELYFTLFAKSYSEALGIDYSRTVDAIKIDTDDTKESEKSNDKKQLDENGDEIEPKSNKAKQAGIVFAVIISLSLVYLGVDKYILNSDENSLSKKDATEQESVASKKLTEAYKNYDWDNKEFNKPTKMKMTLSARQDSWSAIFADGDTAIYRTLRAGRTYQVEADYRMTVSVGIPSAVTITLNGQEVDLRNSESRRIYKVLINQMNIDDFLNRDESKAEASVPKKATVQPKATNQQVVASSDSVSTKNNEANE